MSGMQAALLIRREKQRLRGGKVVNFRELPSNLATRLIPPLPRYPPRSYVYGVSIKVILICCIINSKLLASKGKLLLP